MIGATKSPVEITALLPHRGEALFIDQVTLALSHASGQACWSEDHPHLRGHFPGLPLVPGVFLIEAIAQLAGLVIATRDASGRPLLGVLAGIKRALFHRPVKPAQRITFEVDVSEVMAGGFHVARGIGHDHERRKVVTAEVTIAVINPASVRGN